MNVMKTKAEAIQLAAQNIIDDEDEMRRISNQMESARTRHQEALDNLETWGAEFTSLVLLEVEKRKEEVCEKMEEAIVGKYTSGTISNKDLAEVLTPGVGVGLLTVDRDLFVGKALAPGEKV